MLYFVSTPIGNLEDISLRALSVLRECDVVACEDTRHSKVLLQKYDIKVRTIAYHKHNEQASSDGIIEMLKAGKKVAVVSDSGMPVISDPGNILIKKLIENSLEYTVIPGANAALCALVLSGFDASKFAFFGFLSENKKQRLAQLKSAESFKGTRIFYSSKHNVNKDLGSLFEVFGKARVAIVSEITKIHEKVRIVELPFEVLNPKGEFVLVVEFSEQALDVPSDEELMKELTALAKKTGKTQAIVEIKDKYGLAKSYVYNLFEKNK